MISLYPLEYLRAAFEFLDWLHEQGYVHGDMSNIQNTMLLSSKNELTVDDFVFIDFNFSAPFGSQLPIAPSLNNPCWVQAVPGLDIYAVCSSLLEEIQKYQREKEWKEIVDILREILSQSPLKMNVKQLFQQFPLLIRKQN